MAGTTIARTAPPPAPEASEPLTTTPPTTVVPTTPPPTTQVETIVTCGEVFLTTLEDGEKAPFTQSVAGEPDAQLLAFAAARPPPKNRLRVGTPPTTA